MDEAVIDTQRNTCSTFYVTADNSRTMVYLSVKLNERIKTGLSKNDINFFFKLRLEIV
jgi:hypothetical protein